MTIFRSLFLGLAALLLYTNTSHAADALGSDPYEHVHSVHLKNGLKVVLAPNAGAKTFQIKVRVKAGFYNEESGKAGVAHLLEHYLFTDAKLDKNMTYLEVIKEKGGSGNAATTAKETTYYATVPAPLSSWIVDIFGKIIFQKNFDETQVQHAKGPVYLEIGKPNAFDYIGLVLQDLWPDFARPEDFWRTEFGIKEPLIKISHPRLQTEHLTAQDLKRFYDREYFPSNITLFVAGKFEEPELFHLIETNFGAEPDRPGKGWEDPYPVARHGSYVRSEVTSGTPRIKLGTKATALSLEDETAGRVYLGYLTHRLMKELRNIRGQTYSVVEDIQLRKGSGYFALRFESPREDYSSNLRLVKDMIEHEARNGEFTEEMFKEARDLYAKGFDRVDRDSSTMMYLADRLDYIETAYPNQATLLNDFKTFQSLKYADFKQRLKSLFSPDMKVQELVEPPLLFRFESLVLWILAFASGMHISRLVFAKHFPHDKIRWVRKVSFPPAYSLQIVTFLTNLLGSILIGGAMTAVCVKVDFIQRSYLLSDYLFDAIWIGAVLLFSQIVLGLIARKLMIVDDSLWIKSLGYRSFTIKLSEIKSVETYFPFALVFTPKMLWRVKYRSFYYDPCFWRKGLLITLENGKSYYVGVRSAKDAMNELRTHLIKPVIQNEPAHSPEGLNSTIVA